MAQVQPLHNSRRDVSVNRCKLYEPVSESISATCHPSLEKIAFSLGTAHFNTPELSQALLSAKQRRMRVRAKLTQSARIAQPPSCRPPPFQRKLACFRGDGTGQPKPPRPSLLRPARSSPCRCICRAERASRLPHHRRRRLVGSSSFACLHQLCDGIVQAGGSGRRSRLEE